MVQEDEEIVDEKEYWISNLLNENEPIYEKIYYNQIDDNQ